MLSSRLAFDPFNGIATVIFALAIIHTFAASMFAAWAHRVQEQADARRRAANLDSQPSVPAEILHFLGEVEVVFGLWAVVLMVALSMNKGWAAVVHYLNETVTYTEPLFVVVIMALASTRPIITFAESGLRIVAGAGGATPAAWWTTILLVGPLLGSLITEPAAMTISALLLARQFYDLKPSRRLRYATLGLLFVNVSIGGTLTHFAAPPILMVARAWGWDTPYVLGHFGVRAVLAIVCSTIIYRLMFRAEFRELEGRPPVAEHEEPETPGVVGRRGGLPPVPSWLIGAHVAFMVWTVVNAHYPALFIGGFLFFLGFVNATAAYQSRIDLRAPLLVGFFLGGLVIHGGLQGWWIAPMLASLSETPLYIGATILTAFNDNALITYLSTLVPNFSEELRMAVVEGAVTGGGLTVIANAPNPAGQALLARFFEDEVVSPVSLAAAAILPTLVTVVLFRAF